jgi:hypothetical protein
VDIAAFMIVESAQIGIGQDGKRNWIEESGNGDGFEEEMDLKKKWIWRRNGFEEEMDLKKKWKRINIYLRDKN